MPSQQFYYDPETKINKLVTIYSPEEMKKLFCEQMGYWQEKNERALALHQETKDEVYKDLDAEVREKIEKLTKENERLWDMVRRSCVTLESKDLEEYQKFKREHWKQCRNRGHFIFDDKSNLFQHVTIIKCPICEGFLELKSQ